MRSASYDLSEAGTERWTELLRTAALSAGIYALPAGGVDTQSPHSEDEVYLVLTGRAVLTVAAERYDAVPGRLLYVAAGVEHRFVEITADLRLLVVFAPPEGSATRDISRERSVPPGRR